MITSIELQVISKVLTTEDEYLQTELLSFDSSYYSVFKPHIEFILNHKSKFNDVPDVFTFQAEFPDVTLVSCNESLEYLTSELKKNKQHIMLLETFNKLKDLGSGDVSDAWQYLSLQCDKASRLESSEPMNIIKDAQKRADQVVEYAKQTRIPTGFPEIDKLMYGGLSTVEEFAIIAARTNSGKAQPLWSNILTPTGWITMRNIEVGDIVVGKDNDNGRVVRIFPQGIKKYYRVCFDDNTFAECCDDHLWEVYVDRSKFSDVQTLATIRQNLKTTKYYVDTCGEILFNDMNLQGDETMTTIDDIYTKLRIPYFIMYGSPEMRLQVFFNLKGKKDYFITYNEYFATQFAWLARSLGYKAKITFNRKQEHFKVKIYPLGTKKQITKIEYIGETECQCIMVNNRSHTYITDDFTVTHNTWILTKMMESAQANGFPVLYYSPEMQASFLGTRFDTWRSHIENSKIFQGKYSSDYLKYIQELSKSETDAFILEDKDTPSGEVNVPVLKNLVQKNKIKLLIIDGMSYMSDPSGGKNDTDYIKYKNIALDLFRLSKQYGCAVVVAMQANRQTLEQKDDKGECLPTIYNLEGSDHPARIATQVFAVRQIFDKHVLDIRLEKSRNAANQKPILSYAWDVNTGNIRYLPDGENNDQDKPVETVIVKPDIVHRVENEEEIDLDEDEDIEF